jgi:cobalt-zinc-cadmium efflux system outer membrane protein
MRSPHRINHLVALAACLLLTAAASAQSIPMVTLDQAVDLALAHNHALQAQRTLILQNQAQEITANLRPNPSFDFDSQFVPLFSPQFFSSAVRCRHFLLI